MRLYTPFIKLKDLKQFQAKYSNWPPRSASPSIAIEPWGKNLFWLNASKTAEFRDHPDAPPWDFVKPQWIRDELRLGLLRPGENPNAFIPSTYGYLDKSFEGNDVDIYGTSEENETWLVITDYRKRPLTWLSLADIQAIAEKMEEFEKGFEEISKFADTVNEAVRSDDMMKRQLVEVGDKFRTYRRGRWMKPRHDYGGRGARTGRLRLKRTT